MKLISMTDFVLDQSKKIYNKEDGNIFAGKVCNYAEFLKKLLELWMFVPCDESGNVLEEPNYYSCFLDNSYLDKPQLINYENCQRYKKAKERVLFEGFTPCIINRVPSACHDKVSIFFSLQNGEKIESISISGLIELTPTAIKQIQQ